MISNKPQTIRYENTLDFTHDRWHHANDLPSSRTTGFSAAGCLHRCTLSKLPGGRFVGVLVAGVRQPTEQVSTVIRIGQNLKDSGEHAGLWAIAVEPLVNKRELF